MSALIELVNRIAREDEGQDMVEYALVLGVIAIAGITAIIALGPKIADLWSDADAGVPAVD
ncbi:MAG: Flp family type IVb pilin [Thermomicrobiales bacterium]